MSTIGRYQLPIHQTQWTLNGQSYTTLTWDYDNGKEKLLALYNKGKEQQWDASKRLDWSVDLDPENPMNLPDADIQIFGSPVWDKLNAKERMRVRHHVQAHSISQFVHAEQGALIASARIVQNAPSIDAKFFAATQVMDEARHVEAFSRLLHEKMEIAYPMTPGLKTLIEQTLSDSRWDITYLGMQVLIEGLALGAFQRLRDTAQNPLIRTLMAYVMQDEARHVAFGRLTLREFYPQLTEGERAEREEFVVEASYQLRDRFDQREIWEALDLPVQDCLDASERSERMKLFRTRLFSRIVPTVKDIGLWGKKVQDTFAKMGALEFANVDAEAMLEQDGRIAVELDSKDARVV